MNFVFSLEIDDFINLISTAFEKFQEQRAWEMWLERYQHMDEKTFIPFSQFYKAQKQPISQRPTEDILDEVAQIREKIKNKRTQ